MRLCRWAVCAAVAPGALTGGEALAPYRSGARSNERNCNHGFICKSACATLRAGRRETCATLGWSLPRKGGPPNPVARPKAAHTVELRGRSNPATRKSWLPGHIFGDTRAAARRAARELSRQLRRRLRRRIPAGSLVSCACSCGARCVARSPADVVADLDMLAARAADGS